jgi:hypothetical protein
MTYPKPFLTPSELLGLLFLLGILLWIVASMAIADLFWSIMGLFKRNNGF